MYRLPTPTATTRPSSAAPARRRLSYRCRRTDARLRHRYRDFRAASRVSAACRLDRQRRPDVIVDSFTMTGGALGSNLGANGAHDPSVPRQDASDWQRPADRADRQQYAKPPRRQCARGHIGPRKRPARQRRQSGRPAQYRVRRHHRRDSRPRSPMSASRRRSTRIETRLAQNDGILLEEGALFAGGIRDLGQLLCPEQRQRHEIRRTPRADVRRRRASTS